MKQGAVARYQFILPVNGTTIRLCVKERRIVFYASIRISNPNSAFYDYKLEVENLIKAEERCGEVYEQGTPTIDDINTTGKRQAPTELEDLSDTTLYMSVEGIEEKNTFDLESTVGDTTGKNVHNNRKWLQCFSRVLMGGFLEPTHIHSSLSIYAESVPVEVPSGYPPHTPSEGEEDDTAFFWALVGGGAGGGILVILVSIVVVGWIAWAIKQYTTGNKRKNYLLLIKYVISSFLFMVVVSKF